MRTINIKIVGIKVNQKSNGKGEGTLFPFEYILDSCLHFLRNLNEILHMGIISVFLSKSFPHFSMIFKPFPPKRLSQISARCFKHLLVSQESHY